VTDIPANCWISAEVRTPHAPATEPVAPGWDAVGLEGVAAGALGAAVGGITAVAVAGTELGGTTVGAGEPADEPQALTVITIASTADARNLVNSSRSIRFNLPRVPGRRFDEARDPHDLLQHVTWSR
jgi:hypothetical protein